MEWLGGGENLWCLLGKQLSSRAHPTGNGIRTS